MKKAVQIIEYVDDIAETIVAKELHRIECICSTVTLRIKRWLITAKLQLTASQPYPIYEGIIIDARLYYKVNVEKASGLKQNNYHHRRA